MHSQSPINRPAPAVALETHRGPYLFTYHPRSSGVVVSRCVYVRGELNTDEIHGHVPYDACGEVFDPSAIVDAARLEGWAQWWLMKRGEWDRETRVMRVRG